MVKNLFAAFKMSKLAAKKKLLKAYQFFLGLNISEIGGFSLNLIGCLYFLLEMKRLGNQCRLFFLLLGFQAGFSFKRFSTKRSSVTGTGLETFLIWSYLARPDTCSSIPNPTNSS